VRWPDLFGERAERALESEERGTHQRLALPRAEERTLAGGTPRRRLVHANGAVVKVGGGCGGGTHACLSLDEAAGEVEESEWSEGGREGSGSLDSDCDLSLACKADRE
jgi:hypothetical protein